MQYRIEIDGVTVQHGFSTDGAPGALWDASCIFAIVGVWKFDHAAKAYCNATVCGSTVRVVEE